MVSVQFICLDAAGLEVVPQAAHAVAYLPEDFVASDEVVVVLDPEWSFLNTTTPLPSFTNQAALNEFSFQFLNILESVWCVN